MGYASCLMLAAGILPWLPVCELLDGSLPSQAHFSHGLPFDCSGFLTKDYYSGDPLSHPLLNPVSPTFVTGHSLHLGILDSMDARWLVLLIVILVHGLFDVDELWSQWWQYALTVPLCLSHMILTNVFYALLGHLRVSTPTPPLDANATLPCPSGLHHAQLLSPVPPWDGQWGLLCRTNLFTAFSFVVAHLVGQSIANWTSLHRCRLFLTTGAAQAKLHRLSLVESELDQLTHRLVPAPLAEDLGRDFISGYLGWSSPLVIYLRNVSFLSAELVGLSSLASSISASPTVSTQVVAQFVAFVNDLFNCFDRLAKREGCYRVRLNSSECLYIAGYPETRVDHARSCVDFGLSMLAITNELSEMSGVKLELRIAVHTGTAYAAVLGRTRLGFELTGDDVLYVSALRQTAVRPGRVLTSRLTFNQLPEGFRGEAGPVLNYPYPINAAAQALEPFPPSSFSSMDTYFVQPRQIQPSSTRIEIDMSELGDTNPHRDWPKLSELCTDNLHLVSRIAATASIVCRRTIDGQPCAVQSLAAAEVPFDYLDTATSDRGEAFDKLADVRLDLLHSLSGNRFNEAGSTASIRTARDPDAHLRPPDPTVPEPLIKTQSFGHELDMAAVVTDKCVDSKLVPFLRRAGKLRGKNSVDGTDLSVHLNNRPTTCADNSMATSITTTITTTATAAMPTNNPDYPDSTGPGHPEVVERMWKPLLNQLPWLNISPPGCQPPHWLTLREKPLWTTFCDGFFSAKMVYAHLADSMSSDHRVDIAPQSRSRPAALIANSIAPIAFRTDPLHRLRVMRFAILALLPLVIALAILNTLLVSRSFMFLLAHLVALVYLLSQLVALRLLRRCSHLGFLNRPTFSRIFMSSSVAAPVAAVAVTWSACQPSLLVNASTALNNTNVPFVMQSASSTLESGQLCPLPFEFTLLVGLSCMLPAVLCQATMFAAAPKTVEFGYDSHLTKHDQLSPEPVLLNQLSRFCIGCTVLLLHTTAFVWSTLNSRWFSRSQLRGTGKSHFTSETGVAIVTFAQTLLFLVAFLVLSFLLPRSLEYQSYLLRQWNVKGHEAANHLLAVRSALAHLLVSVVPRFAITDVYSPKKSPEVYSSSHPFVGFALIQLTVSTGHVSGGPDRTSETNGAVAAGNSDADEPSQVADRLRLLNHLIGMIDGLADGEVRERPNSEATINDRNQVNHTVSLGSDHQLTKVHVGGTAIGYAIGLSSTNTSQSRQIADLLSFTERALEACEEVNMKARSTNTFIHARIALHTGPAVVGLIGKRRPVFTMWGNPAQVCLHLLQESHVPALNRQHLILATDAVIGALPPGRLTTGSLAGQPLIWRCVNAQSGRILLSSQLPTTAAPSAPNGSGRKQPPCPILHFCSIPAASVLEPDSEYMNKAAFAVLNLARSASLRASHMVSVPPHKSSCQVASPEASSKCFNGRQSAHLSRLPTTSLTSAHSSTQTVHSVAVTSSTNLDKHPAGRFVIAQPTVQQFNRSHPLQPAPPVAAPPPPPPPHQRAYSSQGLQACLGSAVPSTAYVWSPPGSSVVASHSQVGVGPPASLSLSDGLCDILACQPTKRIAPAGHSCSMEPPSVATRQAFRRGVVSQCAPRSHEYSIVHVEPLASNPGRVHSNELKRRCLQPSVIGSPAKNDGGYWHNSIPHPPSHKLHSENRADSHNSYAQCVKHPGAVVTTDVIAQAEKFHNSASQQPNQSGIPRSLTLSSTDSFLAAEMACAEESGRPVSSASPAVVVDLSSEDDAAGDVEATDVISHHNPLYTDNEYESMAESQGNLCFQGQSKSNIAHIRAGSGNSNGDSQQSGDVSLFSKRGDIDFPDRCATQSAFPFNRTAVGHPAGQVLLNHHIQTRPSEFSTQAQWSCAVGTTPGSIGGALYSTTSSAQPFNFPDIRRPSSPKCVRDPKLTTRPNMPLNFPNVTAGYGTRNYAAVGVHNCTGQFSSFASSVARSAPVSSAPSGNRVHPPSSNGRSINMPSNAASLEPIAPHGTACLVSEPSISLNRHTPNTGMAPPSTSQGTTAPHLDADNVEAEYAGTYSLGPLSMVVQPSIAGDGLTSCEEDYDEHDSCIPTSPQHSSAYRDHTMADRLTGTKDLPVTSSSGLFGFDLSAGRPTRCMTDSLVANPDLDAPNASDTSDFSEQSDSGSHHAPRPRQTHFSHLSGLALLSHSAVNGDYASQSEGPQMDIELTESEADEVFAYHGCPGACLNRPSTTQVPQILYEGSQASYAQPIDQSSNREVFTSRTPPKGHWFPTVPGQHFVSGRSVLLQRPQPPRSTLPAVAPVKLPNFHRPHGLSPPIAVPQRNTFLSPPEANGTSEYDNLCPNSSLLNKTRPLETKSQSCDNHPSGPIWNGASPDACSLTSPVEATSDVVSKYDGGASASIYDSGDDEEDALAADAVAPHQPVEPLVNGVSSRHHSVSPISVEPSKNSILPPSKLPVPIDPRWPVTSNAIQLQHTPSSAGSHTSSIDQQRSEYDNVDRSHSPAPVVPRSAPSVTRADTTKEISFSQKPRSGHISRRSGSFGEHPERCFGRGGGGRNLWDAEIAAEARRISHQFRAMGWLPTSSYITLSAGVSPAEKRRAFVGTATNLPLPSSKFNGAHGQSNCGHELAPTHLFLIPTGTQTSTPCSRHASLGYRNRRCLGTLDSDTVTSVTSQFDEDRDYLYDSPDASELECGGVKTTASANGSCVFGSLSVRDLGCIMIRPRSLSATCLNTLSALEQYEVFAKRALLPSSPSELNSSGSESDEHVGSFDKTVLSNNATSEVENNHSPCLRDSASRPNARQRHAVRRTKSTLPTHPSARVNREDRSPGFSRLQRRAARVRSLIPPELQPYILPGCMSSLSRSSSIASHVSHGQTTDFVFLSLLDGKSSSRSHDWNAARRSGHLIRSTSDPELCVRSISTGRIHACPSRFTELPDSPL
ncbi:unnamed protein product [Dicrocoelium dendriticum]|nr:unnamed protein product [Dicrocoelium dendriticum]